MISENWMLASKHSVSKQINDTKNARTDTSEMYFRIYKHAFYSVRKYFLVLLSCVFSKNWNYISNIDWRKSTFQIILTCLILYTFLVLAFLFVINNMIQESDHSYSISVFLQDMPAYSDNSHLIIYATINSLVKK